MQTIDKNDLLKCTYNSQLMPILASISNQTRILIIDLFYIVLSYEPRSPPFRRRTQETRQTKIHRSINSKKVHKTLFRLLAFRVFITPANGINTELAKNLILAGVNVSIYDDAIITEDDF